MERNDDFNTELQYLKDDYKSVYKVKQTSGGAIIDAEDQLVKLLLEECYEPIGKKGKFSYNMSSLKEVINAVEMIKNAKDSSEIADILDNTFNINKHDEELIEKIETLINLKISTSFTKESGWLKKALASLLLCNMQIASGYPVNTRDVDPDYHNHIARDTQIMLKMPKCGYTDEQIKNFKESEKRRALVFASNFIKNDKNLQGGNAHISTNKLRTGIVNGEEYRSLSAAHNAIVISPIDDERYMATRVHENIHADQDDKVISFIAMVNYFNDSEDETRTRILTNINNIFYKFYEEVQRKCILNKLDRASRQNTIGKCLQAADSDPHCSKEAICNGFAAFMNYYSNLSKALYNTPNVPRQNLLFDQFQFIIEMEAHIRQMPEQVTKETGFELEKFLDIVKDFHDALAKIPPEEYAQEVRNKFEGVRDETKKTFTLDSLGGSKQEL